MPTPLASAGAAAFDPMTAPRRLNLGCGWDHRAGYANVDFHGYHQPDLVADVRKLGFLPAGHYEEIVAQDILEHLPRQQTLAVLRHWNRLLRMGGMLELRVPNVIALTDLLKTGECRDPEKQKEVIHYLFGTQANTGDYHFTTFTDVLLEHYLSRAGFAMRRIEPHAQWLYDVTAEKMRDEDGPDVFDFDELHPIAGDREFVRACYRTMLAREPDPGELAQGLRQLASDGSRHPFMRTLLDSEESRSRKRYE